MSSDNSSTSEESTRRSFLKHGIVGACATAGLGASYAYYRHKEDSTASQQKKVSSSSNLPTIVVITLDTTRADHLSCYGHTNPTSPNIDRFAAESLVYENAIAPATWTLPSHASLFTGKLVTSHGARKDVNGSLVLTNGINGPVAWNRHRARKISDDEVTLADLLRSSGYTTNAVVAGPWMKKVFGLNKGFDVYDDSNIFTLNARPGIDVTDQALELMRKPNDQPRFLFLNYFDPHGPYHPPDQYARKFVPGGTGVFAGGRRRPTLQEKVGLYDAEILYMDHHIGRLFDGLKELDLFDNAWIVVTADHGELFGEHGAFGHGGVPFQEVVHVPMIVKSPGTQGQTGRSNEWIQLTDVLPMLLDAINVEIPEGIQGRVRPASDRPAIIECQTLPGIDKGGDWLAIIKDGWKYVWSSEGNHMYFNLNDDPREENNLFTTYPQEARRMDDAMHTYLAGLPEPGAQSPTQIVDEEMQKTLKSLGYLE